MEWRGRDIQAILQKKSVGPGTFHLVGPTMDIQIVNGKFTV